MSRYRMDILSTLLILITVSTARVESAGFGNWFNQAFESFGRAWEEFGDSFKNLGEYIKSTTDDLLWFKGPNVCKTEENKTDPFSGEFKDYFGNSNNYDAETCRERDFKLVCIARISENGATRQRVRIYECCPGYVGSYANGKKCVKAN